LAASFSPRSTPKWVQSVPFRTGGARNAPSDLFKQDNPLPSATLYGRSHVFRLTPGRSLALLAR